VRTAEVTILDEGQLAERLTDMRVWLDRHQFEPSSFAYFNLNPGMTVWISFKVDAEAEAYVHRFGGSLLVGLGTA